MWAVNSGTSIEAGDNGTVIELGKGESMSVTITMNFKLGGANNNALTLFKVTQAMNGMKLGVSMSIKLGV